VLATLDSELDRVMGLAGVDAVTRIAQAGLLVGQRT
jgi:hypothetical protein